MNVPFKHLPLLIMLAVLIVTGGGIYVYQKTNTERSGGLPVIRAPSAPYKVRPEDPGGMKISHEHNRVFDLLAPAKTDIAERFVPPKRVPLPTEADTKQKSVESSDPVAEIIRRMPAGGEEAHWRIQLSAVKNFEAAMPEWQRLKRRYAPLLADAELQIESRAGNEGERDASDFFRLQVSGYSEAEAQRLCERIRTEHDGGCFVIAP